MKCHSNAGDTETLFRGMNKSQKTDWETKSSISVRLHYHDFDVLGLLHEKRDADFVGQIGSPSSLLSLNFKKWAVALIIKLLASVRRTGKTQGREQLSQNKQELLDYSTRIFSLSRAESCECLENASSDGPAIDSWEPPARAVTSSGQASGFLQPCLLFVPHILCPEILCSSMLPDTIFLPWFWSMLFFSFFCIKNLFLQLQPHHLSLPPGLHQIAWGDGLRQLTAVS